MMLSARRCIVDDCFSLVAHKNMCDKHYRRMLIHGDVTVDKRRTFIPGKCEAPGCERMRKVTIYCEMHYKRLKQGGQLERRICYAGEIRHSSNGYLLITIDGKVIKHHTYIAEIALGRKLIYPEQIHHIDENKMNNKLSNLYLCKDNKEHLGIHAMMRNSPNFKLVSNLPQNMPIPSDKISGNLFPNGNHRRDLPSAPLNKGEINV